ncbi:hypothetical protein KL941_003178 [Ogataea angusta]|nr:hypothetical protein KL941_003178 [Ogataea angusta]
MNTGAGNEEVPRDVRLLHLIFATQGIQSYQDHVPLQLMDFAYRYTCGVLQDAVLYNDHAYASANGGASAGMSNAPLSNEDIRLAIAARTNYQFKPVPPKKLLLKLAAERNEKPLPPVMPAWGVRLPPEKYCLTAKDWELDEEEDEGSEGEAKRQRTQVVEKTIGESLDERTSILENISDLGPPDMVHLKKHNSSSSSKHPFLGTFLYYTGADVSNSATIAALLNSLSNIIGEEPQIWFGKEKHWKVTEATYCTYNVFSKVDVRVTCKFPGQVESYMIDGLGNKVSETDRLWTETFVSAVVRALISADADVDDFTSVVEIRKINPFLNKECASLFVKGFEELYNEGPKLGCSEDLQVPTRCNNYLVDAFVKCIQLTGMWEEGVAILSRITQEDHTASYLIAKLYLLNNQEIKAVKVMYDTIKLNPLDGEMLTLQAQYCLNKKKLDLALPIAIKAVNSTPSYFKPWSVLVETYIQKGDYEKALLTLNSCPMVTHKDKFVLKRVNNPQSEDLHLPLPMDVTLPNVTSLSSLDIAAEHEKVDHNLLNLAAANLKSTFAKAYKLLTDIVLETGWESLLKYRTKVFVMEDEFKKENAQPSLDSSSGSSEAANGSAGSQFKKKRLCERWLDNLFMLLYEDLRTYTMYRAQVMHFEAQQLDLEKTTLEWELLGLVSERLGHQREAAQCYERGLALRFAVRSSKKLLDYYTEQKKKMANVEALNKLNDQILDLVVNLTVWFHRWYCSFSPKLILGLAGLINEVGRTKVENEIKVKYKNNRGVYDLVRDNILYLEEYGLIEND